MVIALTATRLVKSLRSTMLLYVGCPSRPKEALSAYHFRPMSSPQYLAYLIQPRWLRPSKPFFVDAQPRFVYGLALQRPTPIFQKFILNG